MDTQHIAVLAKAHDGKRTVSTEIPVSGDAESSVVTSEGSPQPATTTQTLDQLYGALADSPVPEIVARRAGLLWEELPKRDHCAT
jgi:hypothetical protein